MDRNVIVADALESDVITQSDYKRFLGDQVLNVLYEINRPISISELNNKLGENQIYLTVDELRNILHYLEAKKFLPNTKNSMIVLTDDCRRLIASKTQKLKECESNVVKRYFLDGIETHQDSILKWLIDTLTLIFRSYYATVLGHVLNSNNVGELENFDIERQCNPIFDTYHIVNSDRQILCSSLRTMLNSITDPDVNYIILYFLYVGYQAKVASSKSFVVPDIAQEFRGRTFFLDTNVLIALQLEKANTKKVNFNALVDLCQKLDIHLKYLFETKTEYENVLATKKNIYRGLMVEYTQPVFSGARANNIVEALVNRGCYSVQAVEHFFDEFLSGIPSFLYNSQVAIELINPQESKGAFVHYNRNEQNKEKFRKIFIENENEQETDYEEYAPDAKKHLVKKNDTTLEHDLGLIGVVRTERGCGEYAEKLHKIKRDTPLLLTMDNSIVMYAQSQYPEEKFVYNVRDLIVLLSLDRGGMLDSKENFGPILQHFVANHFITWEDTYEVKDLALIYNLESQVASLSDAQVQQIAREVNKKRRLRQSPDQIHKYLSNELNLAIAKANKKTSELLIINNSQDEIIKQLSKQVALLQQKQQTSDTKEFYRLLKKETQKRKRRKNVYIGTFVLTVLVLLLFLLCVVSKINFIMNLIDEKSKLYAILSASWINNMSSIVFVLQIISFIWDIVGARLYCTLKVNGYFEKDTIIKKIFTDMEIDRDTQEYIKMDLLKQPD